MKGTKAEEEMEVLDRLPDMLLDAVEEVNPISFRTFSSAGSEHLPYKQGVTSSNLVVPTLKIKHLQRIL